MKRLFYTFICFLILTWSAYAVPYLQLDIIDDAGKTYDTVTDTIVSNSPTFTLRALIDTGSSHHTKDSNQFVISMAILPSMELSDGQDGIGSFTFTYDEEGVLVEKPYDVTGDMVFGTPPIDTYEDPNLEPVDSSLPTHGVFETYYSEFKFNLADGDVSKDVVDLDFEYGDRYNTENDTPEGGDDLVYAEFLVDLTLIPEDMYVHFDFYSLDPSGKKFLIKAPFSHDAEGEGGGGDGDDDYVIPEPGTLILFGFGLIGLAGVGRRKSEIV